MRFGVLTGARAVLLAGPVALAFFSGGYFDAPRAWAGVAAWALVAVAVLGGSDPLPRGRGPRVALGGLGLLAAWTLASAAWAPISGSAYHAGQRVVLYTGVLLAANALLRDRSALRTVEPAIAAGTLAVVGYGIAERLVPGLLSFHHSVSAQGRLEQPLTYWNAMGEVAALGVVLCARLAGDCARAARMRLAAAAASVPLGMGLYLTFSRGALFACAAGLVAVMVASARREQLQGALLVVGAGGLTAIAAAPFSGVTSLLGGRGTREAQGAGVLLLATLLAITAAAAQHRILRRQTGGPVPLPRHAPAFALVLVCALFGLSLAVGAKEHSAGPLSAGATRYATLQSNRYAYWRVAARAFGDQPLRGVGAGGWAVYWRRLRPFAEGAQDAHSLYLQTAAELGLVGLTLLAALLGGVAWAARAAHRAGSGAAVGLIGGLVVWAAHVAIDWDWEMPAVTLPALVMAGALLALAEPQPDVRRPAAGERGIRAPRQSAAPRD